MAIYDTYIRRKISSTQTDATNQNQTLTQYLYQLKKTYFRF